MAVNPKAGSSTDKVSVDFKQGWRMRDLANATCLIQSGDLTWPYFPDESGNRDPENLNELPMNTPVKGRNEPQSVAFQFLLQSLLTIQPKIAYGAWLIHTSNLGLPRSLIHLLFTS